MMAKAVLDACCGSRMFWFDGDDPRGLFVDNRTENCILCDGRTLSIQPDMLADFRALPFTNCSFSLVVFDPPHLIRAGKKSWLALKYGRLSENWHEDLRKGFKECFRVLKPHGTLIFKWNETQVPLREVLSLTDEKPLFGNRQPKVQGTHWIVFMKGGTHE